MRKRLAATLALAVTGGAADPARAALSATGAEPADPTRPALIAGVEETVTVHAAPAGRKVGRVRARTPFGSPTRLAVLERRDEWLRVSRERLGDAWVRLGDVRLSSTPYRVLISLSKRRLELREGNRVLVRSAVAVGTSASPTPTGSFGVTDALDGRRYDGVYGCCVLAISAVQTNLPRGWAGGDRIALHGTNSPSSFGRAVSSGCVRVHERPLREMMRRVPLGTPVIIRR